MASIIPAAASSPTMPPRFGPYRSGRVRSRCGHTLRPRASARRPARGPRGPRERASRSAPAVRRVPAARSGRRRQVRPRGSHSRTSGSSAASSPASTYGGFETTRSNGPSRPASRSPSRNSTASAVRLGVLLRQLESARRDVRGVDAGARAVPARSRARSRRCPYRRRRPGATRSRRAAARQRSTTISVSGRGTSARASVFSVKRRKSQSPST